MQLRHALTRAPQHVRHRAAWLHHWTVGSAGACIQRADSAVRTGDGTWHPGGVALAGTLQLSITSNAGFRLVLARGQETADGHHLAPASCGTTVGGVR